MIHLTSQSLCSTLLCSRFSCFLFAIGLKIYLTESHPACILATTGSVHSISPYYTITHIPSQHTGNELCIVGWWTRLWKCSADQPARTLHWFKGKHCALFSNLRLVEWFSVVFLYLFLICRSHVYISHVVARQQQLLSSVSVILDVFSHSAAEALWQSVQDNARVIHLSLKNINLNPKYWGCSNPSDCGTRTSVHY